MFQKKLPPLLSGRIILAGNPNVGKSTLFNCLTGMRAHTGNWAGKTVSVSTGYGVHNRKKYLISDLPGIASLSVPDAEELSAFRAITQTDYDCCVIVADATNLSRSLTLVLRILEITPKCVLAINLCDEAEKRGITIDREMLQFILGVPVVLTSAGCKKGLSALMDKCEEICGGNIPAYTFTPLYGDKTEKALAALASQRQEAVTRLYFSPDPSLSDLKNDISLRISVLAEKIAKTTTKKAPQKTKDELLDKIFCSPIFGIPVMLLLLGIVLYITIVLSNYPSECLSALFDRGKLCLSDLFARFPIPKFFSELIIHGIYSTTATVISVMLPPMTIFFPFFTVLEDFGYLPRVAFNLDNAFKKCGSCGKQSLTMCMGLGCNCVGITGSAIIPSERERLISILTNSFTPCNGRFGAIIASITMFFAFKNPLLSCAVMVGVLVFSFFTTFLSSALLSKTLLSGERSGFTLELPSYRKPRIINVIVSSIVERTAVVLFRAISVAAPLGALIYSLNYFSLLSPMASFLNPLGRLMGLDGIILLAFILALPANEIVFPIILMLYTQSSIMVDYSSVSALSQILLLNGWSIKTAASFIIFTLMHFPCGAALLTIKKETSSVFWTAVSILLPLSFGIFFCILSNVIFSLFIV